MKKEKFHITLITSSNKEEYNLLGEYDKDSNIISYYESNSLRSKIVVDINKHLLIKENIDYKITIDLDVSNITKGKIELKKENQVLELEIKTNSFKFLNNNLTMKYTIIDSSEEIEYEIKIGG